MTSTVILSPHLDDAVFSCWHLLTQPGAIVITIFAGTPVEGTTTLWDKICGEPNSAAMMRKRIHENEDICKEIGVNCYNLSYKDKQYSPAKRNVPGIVDAILAHADNDAAFFAPLAGSKVWRHPDHVTARDVGISLLNTGRKVSFYADIPYMQMPINLSESYKKRITQKASKLIGHSVLTEISELHAADQILKSIAMRQYKSQYKMTNFMAFGTLGRRANIQREIVYHTT